MKKREISAKVIADSITPEGKRLTSMVLVFPRIVLAEFNTHRMFSRNSASSRAIPFKKMLESVQTDPFIPIKWMKDHRGMQGNDFIEEPSIVSAMQDIWLKARDQAILHTKILAGVEKAGTTEESYLSFYAATRFGLDGTTDISLTKQIVNRLLEPFLWHTVIVTATEWENFFALRAHEAAEIHIQELAYKMLDAYNESEPTKIEFGEWHIPFGDKINKYKIDVECWAWDDGGKTSREEWLNKVKVAIATARCARVSYSNFDGTDDYGKDLELYDKLSSIGHWSPFEHCAKAVSKSSGIFTGNFDGWLQARHTFKNENKKDNRVIKK